MKMIPRSIFLLVCVLICSAAQHAFADDGSATGPDKANASASRTRLYVITENKKLGYMDSTGRVVLPPRYDDAGQFSEGRGRVRFANGKYGFVDTEGKVVIQPQFDGAGDFHEGLARVTIGNKSGFVDESGKLVIPLRIGEGPRAIPWGVADFSDGLAWTAILSEQPSGYIDKTGVYVFRNSEIHFGQYSGQTCCEDYREGLAVISLYSGANKKVGYLDKKGQIAIPPTFDDGNTFAEGLAPVATRAQGSLRWGYVDHLGRIVIPYQFDSAKPFSEGLASAWVGKKCGYVNKSGELAIAAKYDWCEHFSEGLAPVTMGKKLGFIDATGQMKIAPRFDGAQSFLGGLAGVSFEGHPNWTSGYVDKDGRVVWQSK